MSRGLPRASNSSTKPLRSLAAVRDLRPHPTPLRKSSALSAWLPRGDLPRAKTFQPNTTMTPTHPFNGTLTRDPEQGYIWKTNCTGCRTEQHIRLGSVSLEEARRAVDIIDRTPRECPAGFHVELSGWRYYWSLDLMLERYAAATHTLPRALSVVNPA